MALWLRRRTDAPRTSFPAVPMAWADRVCSIRPAAAPKLKLLARIDN
eukprot:CAMPEP_0194696220 /NCGR_PEP_ID=MMETSP0295-20121207/22531_1 /TAXON_ID=39354 /ORGANISM="Heterosigma akashiwo, Strain CCMP2393" /LENGTH=46 /DNA_ID= /DNA_START= /DNA_END= /DNA_ORIENTATION=